MRQRNTRRLLTSIRWAAVGILSAHSSLLVVAAVPALAQLISRDTPLAAYLAPTSWQALTVEVLLVGTMWMAFVFPRFRRGIPSTFGIVSALGALAFTLAYASYAACSGVQAPFFTAVSRSLLIFLGAVEDPFGSVNGCAPSMPLALQSARLAAIVAVGVGVIAALARLFRPQLDRALARFAREIEVVVGSPLTNRRLLERIAHATPRRRIVVLTEEEVSQSLLPHVSLIRIPAEGARIPSVLRGAARFRSVYLLDRDVTRVLDWIETLRSEFRTNNGTGLVIIARIDDIWQAEHWRRELISTNGAWLVDVISPFEQTARALVDHLIGRGVRRVIVAGRSPLRLALASELALRRRERLVVRWPEPAPPELLFVGEDAERAHRHHLMHQARFGNVDDVSSDARFPSETTLASIIGAESNAAVVLTDADDDSFASALARNHPTCAIYVRDDTSTGLSPRPVLNALYPFGIDLDLNPDGELHVWERAARIIHNNYLHDHGTGSGPAAVEWARLSPFYRNSNLRLVTTALASVVAIGRTWGASEGPSTGSGHGIPPAQLRQIARIEHGHWAEHYRAAGWRYSPERDDAHKRHPRLL